MTCLALAGDTFSRMMNGRFKSTRHRVMDINRERYAVPFFFEPDFYADISIDWISQITGGWQSRRVAMLLPTM